MSNSQPYSWYIWLLPNILQSIYIINLLTLILKFWTGPRILPGRPCSRASAHCRQEAARHLSPLSSPQSWLCMYLSHTHSLPHTASYTQLLDVADAGAGTASSGSSYLVLACTHVNPWYLPAACWSTYTCVHVHAWTTTHACSMHNPWISGAGNAKQQDSII